MKLRHFVVSSLAALCVSGAQAVETKPTMAEEEASSRINFDVADRPLDTVLGWISRRAGVNIVCYEAEQPRVTMRLTDVTWQDAVEQIAEKYDLVIEKSSDRIWQLTRPPKVRMEFQDARLTVVLEALARQANVNIVISDDVNSGKRLTMALNGVPWREALDVIVKATGYTWVEQKYNIIRVVSKENVQKDLQTRVFHLNYTKAGDAEKSVAVAMSADGKLVNDARTNSLVITDTPINLEAASAIISQLDTRTREVLIEMKFVEYSTTEAQKIGFDPISLNMDIEKVGNMDFNFLPFSSPPTATLGATRGAVAPSDTRVLSAGLTFELISALQSTEIVQTPQVLTLDNISALIKIGRELRFAEETVTQENGVTVRTLKEASSSPLTDGITITVTPHITTDGYVSIDLDAKDENATLQEFSSGTSKISLPQKTINQVKTSIMVADTQTAVIGGLLKNKVQEQDNTIPYLSKVPVLGWLFRKRSDGVEQRNLTMFITPHVLANHDRDEMHEASLRLREKISGLQLKPVTPSAEQRSLKDTKDDK